MNENRTTNVIGDEAMVPMEMIKSIDRMVAPTGIKDYTKRVLIENFLKKENEEKGKTYEDILKEKYEVLDQFRDKLKLKEEELASTEKEMKEQIEEIKNEIEEIKNEISRREKEIKVIEKYGKKSEVVEISEEELKENEKMDGQGGNNGSAEERNVDTGLTQAEQQEYTRLKSIEAMGKGMGKELSDEQKQRLEELDAKNIKNL